MKIKKHKTLLKMLPLFALALLLAQNAQAFCGFYVAKAGSELFNKSSQVIIARDGNRTVITMSNDFQGDVKDFAMVVPVPVVLKEDEIKISRKDLFDRLDAYSAPRLVEYYDEDPCQILVEYEKDMIMESADFSGVDMEENAPEMEDEYNVTIEAKYSIGEYDILILSAKESGGLERWLTDNGYQIPKGAQEVLEPYIKSQMKFFVVKVNLEKQLKTGFTELNPLQISFESQKFMLPIRLGMANSQGEQDLIVYAFSRTGQVETTNYHTLKIPTNHDIPNFIKPHFGNFYKDTYEKIWKNYGRNDVFLEYAWDLGGYNPVKCDPCVGTPPVVQDMKDAGIFWLDYNSRGYTGDVYITRLHARYSREKFPQDLQFQATPNKERFQGRYVMRHPPSGPLACDEGQKYVRKLIKRRRSELEKLANLTGWDVSQHESYVQEFKAKLLPPKATNTKNNLPGILLPQGPQGPGGNGPLVLFLVLGILAVLSFTLYYRRSLQTTTKPN